MAVLRTQADGSGLDRSRGAVAVDSGGDGHVRTDQPAGHGAPCTLPALGHHRRFPEPPDDPAEPRDSVAASHANAPFDTCVIRQARSASPEATSELRVLHRANAA